VRTLAVALALLACMSLPVHAQTRPPAVAPERAVRPIASVALVNAGFESTQQGPLGAPEGWWAVQHAGPRSYTFTLDTTNPHSGERSLKVVNIGPEPFGSIFQKVGAAPYRGRTLRLAAWLRTEGTKGNRYGAGAGLNLQSMKGGYPIASVMMRKDAVEGTTDWARYEVTLKVPDDAEHVELGLNLFGAGTAWLDDVALDVMDAPAAASVRQ
jgi:Carbohydrate binding domain